MLLLHRLHILQPLPAKGCQREENKLSLIFGCLTGLLQLRAFDELGIAHQDINLANLLAHEAVPGSGDIAFKFGDLNMCQWQQLLLDGK